ncbi:unnamed protein product [Cyprideis torosa]|uniref:Ketoreductase domain-containing protein n=1 Tax=Cyprideis torosa TaxID=163714 RepID=A0A7R8W6S7_9CRUS|nr:unnamed protein product [Cyprideis torosa]CAG0882613.1 unnamed protein product [Cyprideis torosa]
MIPSSDLRSSGVDSFPLLWSYMKPNPVWFFVSDAFTAIGMLYCGFHVTKFLYELSAGFYKFIFARLFPFNLKDNYGPWAVVTGATDGLGLEYAKQLAARGLSVVLISRNPEKLETARMEVLNAADTRTVEVEVLAVDLSSISESTIKTFETVFATKDIGVLINNVGAMSPYPGVLEEMGLEELWRMLDLNVIPGTLLTRLILPGMLLRRRGAIVNVSSASAFGPLPYMTVYAASKAYMDYFSRALQVECQGRGVFVQSLMPFYVQTKMISFSPSLNSASIMVPSARSFVSSSLCTLGRSSHTTGYWTHGVQWWFVSFVNQWWYSRIGAFIQWGLRRDYEKTKGR